MAKRTRTVKPADIRVESALSEQDSWLTVMCDFPDTRSAIKWVEEHGLIGEVYRVIRVSEDNIRLHIEERRSIKRGSGADAQEGQA